MPTEETSRQNQSARIPKVRLLHCFEDSFQKMILFSKKKKKKMTAGGKHSGHKYLMEEKAIVKSRHAEAEKHKLI